MKGFGWKSGAEAGLQQWLPIWDSLICWYVCVCVCTRACRGTWAQVREGVCSSECVQVCV